MEFTTREYAEMHFVYGFCNGNALAAQREYSLRYPDRRAPSPQVFTRLHQRLVESGKVQRKSSEIGPVHYDVGVEELILNTFRENPESSSREIAAQLNVSQWKVLDVLHRNKFHPYHFTPVQALEAEDFVHRVQFCRWLLNSDIEQYHFFKKILWTDEAIFTRQGIFNTHNMHMWAEENPSATKERSFQRRFHIMVWAGVVGDTLIGPHIFEGNLNGERFLDFLQHSLPLLLDHLNQEQRDCLIFQQDGATPHFTAEVRHWLTLNYPTWIGRGGTVAWPARSPDLSPMDFCVWGWMKQKVYSAPINTEQELRERITAAAEVVRQELSTKVTVEQMRKRARACIRNGGRQFEQHL